ncbi:MAG: primosomal protein N' [Clostridia bacterium]|nr:primosomal protein N' [Clostridia bacterium]
MSNLTVVKVAVENTAYSFDMLFEYSVPDFLYDDVVPGKRVLVPFGNASKKRVGIVFSKELCCDTAKKLKKVDSVIDIKPLLTREMLKTSNFIHDMCFCTYFDACKLFLPHGLLLSVNVLYAINPDYEGILDEFELLVCEYLQNKKSFTKGELIVSACGLKNISFLDKMFDKGILLKNVDAQRKMNDATIKMVELLVQNDSSEVDKLTKKQKEVVNILSDVGIVSVKELCYFTGYSSAVISALENKNIIRTFDDEIFRKPYEYVEDVNTSPIILSDEQLKAYSGLYNLFNEEKANGALLYGVTGSGKTKVYLKLIDEALKTDKGIIVMIPEISLTPQMLSLFYSRYGDKVAVFHSALSLGQRLDEWKRVKNGDAKIAIGTRSAVFAPFDDIGLIVIDEEQEHTYKSEMSPRYNAKKVAQYRIGCHKGLLVLSSATPSIDTYTKAKKGIYSLFKLDKRYGKAVLPDVQLIDTTYQSDMILENISKQLADELKENYIQGKQSILLLNRRGYNTYAHCSECGTVSTCPNCSISLTYHIRNGRLMCHYCGYSVPFSKKCDNCNTESVKFSGSGTQKLEEELSQIVPDARILRMDTDTTSSRFSFEKNFKSFGEHKYDILVGTQMVAKGLDFSDVTLVGVLNIDQMLFNDDYKSGERAFDLITQVVGRSGRGEIPGKAYIQTSFPDSEIISMAKEQDYESFYNVELPMRKAMIYPPFCDLCVIGFTSDVEISTKRAANDFLNQLKIVHSKKYKNNDIIVLGPVTPRVAKLGGKFRERIIIKCKNSVEFRRMISELLKQFAKEKKYENVSVYADINPESVM